MRPTAFDVSKDLAPIPFDSPPGEEENAIYGLSIEALKRSAGQPSRFFC